MITKHAFLIGAYKNSDYLLQLIDSLDSDKSNFYIHVNKYNDDDFFDFKQRIANRKNIHYYSKIPVRWGGLTMLKSQLLLCEEALKDPENEFFHFITGQDILIKPLDSLFDFFKNSKCSYLRCKPMDKKEIIYRFYYYHLFDLFSINYAKLSIGLIYEKLLRVVQRLVRLRFEKLPFDTIYQGSAWWSLHRNAVNYCVGKLTNDKRIMKRFRHTFAPDETIFHSILLPVSNEFPIINDNLRYIVWDRSYIGKQKIFEDSDFEELIQSNAFFARKINPSDSKSSMLIEHLHNYLK